MNNVWGCSIPPSGISDSVAENKLDNDDQLEVSKRRVAKLFNARHEYYPLKDSKVFQAEGKGGATAVQSGLILATALQHIVEISRIRACIRQGGLDLNLMNYLMLVQKMTGGEFGGIHFGSKRISFQPQLPYHQEIIEFEVDTKMSTSMEAFNCIPIFLFARPQITDEGTQITCTELQYIGATDTDVLQFEYLDWILIPTLEKFVHMRVEAELLKRGFQINGNGFMCLNVWSLAHATTIKPLLVAKTRRRVKKVLVRIFRSGGGYPKGSLQQILDQVYFELEGLQEMERELFGDQKSFEISDISQAATADEAYGAGLGILLVAETDDGSLIGGQKMGSLWFILAGISGDEGRAHAIDEGKKAATEAVQDLRDQLSTGCCLDKRIHASLIIYMALAQGRSEIWIPEVTCDVISAMKAAHYVAGVEFRTQSPDETRNMYSVSCNGRGILSGSVQPQGPPIPHP